MLLFQNFKGEIKYIKNQSDSYGGFSGKVGFCWSVVFDVDVYDISFIEYCKQRPKVAQNNFQCSLLLETHSRIIIKHLFTNH